MRQTKTALFALLSLVLGTIVLSSCSIKTRIKRADSKFDIGEYYTAADLYKQCYSRVSSKRDRELKAHIAFRQGECYRILNVPKASNCYQNAIRNKYADSIVYLRYAEVLHYAGKYKEADKQYLIYLESHPDSYTARAGHYACCKVDEWRKNPSRYKVYEAREFNQKRTSNFSPSFIGSNGDAIMFTSNRQNISSTQKKRSKHPNAITGVQNCQLFTTRKNAAGTWEEIVATEGLAGDNNDVESESDSTTQKSTASAELGVCCFSADGRTMYFTYSKPISGQDQGAKIYSSQRASGEWGEAQEVKLFDDSTITVAHPALCPSGDTLYFVSDAPGGIGGKDLYMAELNGSEWVNVHNLGASINTAGDEMFPVVHPNGTLYFSSNGHPGFGGLDIFRADRDTLVAGDSIAYLVYNLGAPINSTGDDFSMTFDGNSQNGYFSSNRGQKKAYDLIYQFSLPEMEFFIEGHITDQNGEPVSDARIRLVGDNGTNSRIQVRRDGTYKIKLEKDVRYAMLVTARGYLNDKQTLATTGLNDSKTYNQDFVLSAISKPVTMDNIFYEFGKWTLTANSEQGLQALVKLLNDNPNITIELSAHTDMKGDSVFNKQLSEKRAQSVCDYLVAQGIEAERLKPVGYGKQKPVVANKALHQKYPFIPDEQTLDETFILTLNEEQQEICNQINRRTEFKVLKTTYKLY